MSLLSSVAGVAIAVAGGDKLVDNRGYLGLFRKLGWSQDQMHAVAVAELAGGLFMTANATRRLGGAMVAVTSAIVLTSELQRGDNKMAASRGLVLLAGLLALMSKPSRKLAHS